MEEATDFEETGEGLDEANAFEAAVADHTTTLEEAVAELNSRSTPVDAIRAKAAVAKHVKVLREAPLLDRGVGAAGEPQPASPGTVEDLVWHHEAQVAKAVADAAEAEMAETAVVEAIDEAIVKAVAVVAKDEAIGEDVAEDVAKNVEGVVKATSEVYKVYLWMTWLEFLEYRSIQPSGHLYLSTGTLRTNWSYSVYIFSKLKPVRRTLEDLSVSIEILIGSPYRPTGVTYGRAAGCMAAWWRSRFARSQNSRRLGLTAVVKMRTAFGYALFRFLSRRFA